MIYLFIIFEWVRDEQRNKEVKGNADNLQRWRPVFLRKL